MANIKIAFPDVSKNCVLSAGAWAPGYPQTNLQTPLLDVPARTQDLTLASTKIQGEQNQFVEVGAVALCAHNLSPTAKYRVTLSRSPGLGDIFYQSDWADVWEPSFQGVPFVDIHFWTGRPTLSDLAGYRANLVHWLPGVVLAKSWLIELDDRANPAGYIQIGRTYLGSVFSPIYNYSYGASFGTESRTQLDEADSGAKTSARRIARRSFTAKLDWLSKNEEMRWLDIQRVMDVDEPLIFSRDPDDTFNSFRSTFLATFAQLDKIEHPYPNTHAVPVNFLEVL